MLITRRCIKPSESKTFRIVSSSRRLFTASDHRAPNGVFPARTSTIFHFEILPLNLIFQTRLSQSIDGSCLWVTNWTQQFPNRKFLSNSTIAGHHTSARQEHFLWSTSNDVSSLHSLACHSSVLSFVFPRFSGYSATYTLFVIFRHLHSDRTIAWCDSLLERLFKKF